jgi:hypothetical protein
MARRDVEALENLRMQCATGIASVRPENDNSSSSVLAQQHPPHKATFDLHGNSTAAQMELTGQLLSNLSLLADSAQRTKELRTALKDSFAIVHTMMDEYIQMTKDREEWWKAQLQHERERQTV